MLLAILSLQKLSARAWINISLSAVTVSLSKPHLASVNWEKLLFTFRNRHERQKKELHSTWLYNSTSLGDNTGILSLCENCEASSENLSDAALSFFEI